MAVNYTKPGYDQYSKLKERIVVKPICDVYVGGFYEKRDTNREHTFLISVCAVVDKNYNSPDRVHKLQEGKIFSGNKIGGLVILPNKDGKTGTFVCDDERRGVEDYAVDPIDAWIADNYVGVPASIAQAKVDQFNKGLEQFTIFDDDGKQLPPLCGQQVAFIADATEDEYADDIREFYQDNGLIVNNPTQ